jgi:hypothetical protein
MRLLVSTALALLAAACGPGSLDSIGFDRQESLPGFDLALPTGMREKRTTSDAGGEVALAGRSAMVMVSWKAGRVSAEELSTMARASLELIGQDHGGAAVEQRARTVAAPDYALDVLAPVGPRGVLVLTLVQCVHANVTVFAMTQASRDRGRALRFHDRLLATLRCRDDGAPLATDAGLPAFATGDDAGYLPGSEPPTFYSTRGEQWTISTVTTAAAVADPELVAPLFRRIGLEVVDHRAVPYTGSAGWRITEVTARSEGDSFHLLFGVLPCPGRHYQVIYANLLAIDAPPPSALERVSCPTGPVAPSTLPRAAERLAAACDGDDGLACASLAILGGDEPRLLGGRDAGALLARACQLGVRDACPGSGQ